jgi:hypothetical protein
MRAMKIINIKTVLVLSFFGFAWPKMFAQTMTEVFIPIGQSPGVSGKYSVMGKIESVNLKDSTVTILQDAGGKVSFKITRGCHIYLDKSKLKLRNKKGYCADIKPGMKAEAKYKDNKPGNKVEWVKVQVE